MNGPDTDIAVMVVAGILVLVFFFIFLVYLFLIYQKKKLWHAQEVRSIRENYERELLKAQLEIKEQTLQNISQEIHDNIGQVLSLANLNLTSIEVPEMPKVYDRVDKAMNLISRALESLRNLSKTMDADNITKMGMAWLLRLELEAIEKTGRYSTSLDIKGNLQPLEVSKEIIIYRIIQETINNIIKHARANSIHVSLNYQPTNFLVIVSDNGIGFAPAQIQTHSEGAGIKNMFNRAKLINSIFLIDSKPAQGTRVSLVVPIH